MLLRIAAGTGNDNVSNRPVGSPVSSTWPTNALFTPLLGQSTYIWTAPKQNGFGCCVGRNRSTVKVVPSAESSWNAWLLMVWKFWVLSASDVVPSVWRVSNPSVNWPSVVHSYGSSMPRMLGVAAVEWRIELIVRVTQDREARQAEADVEASHAERVVVIPERRRLVGARLDVGVRNELRAADGLAGREPGIRRAVELGAQLETMAVGHVRDRRLRLRVPGRKRQEGRGRLGEVVGVGPVERWIDGQRMLALDLVEASDSRRNQADLLELRSGRRAQELSWRRACSRPARCRRSRTAASAEIPAVVAAR